MAKFAVYGVFHGTKYLGEFEAETAMDAEEMAAESEANFVSLCCHCANELELDDSSAMEFIMEKLED